MSDFKMTYELMARRSLKDESSFYICCSTGSTCSLPPKSKDLQHANNPRLARGTLHTPSCSVVRPTPHCAETVAVNHLWPEAKAPPPTEQTRDELSNWPRLTIFRLFCGEHSQYSEHRWLGAVSHSWQTARPSPQLKNWARFLNRFWMKKKWKFYFSAKPLFLNEQD